MKKSPKGMEHIFQLIEHFMEVWILNIGLKLGIFNHLKNNPTTSTQLAENLNYRVELVQAWCEAMHACGYLEEIDQKFKLTRWSENFLNIKSSTYMGFLIESIDTLYPPFTSYFEKFNRNKPFPLYTSQHMLNIVNVLSPIAQFVVPLLFAEVPLLKKDPYVLDVGCGKGSYLIAIAEQNPRMRGLGVDKEQIIIQGANEIAKSKGLHDRIKFIQADILNFDLSEKFNCILMSNIIQSFNPEINVQILSQVSSNLSKDGYLIILECLSDESRTGPLYSMLFNMYLRMESLNARTYTLPELKTMLEKSSFRFESNMPIISGLEIISAQLKI